MGTEIHGGGTIQVQIPSWVETSVQELPMVAGSDPVRIWAEVRDEKGFPVKGSVPEWKVEGSGVVSIEKIPGTGEVRSVVALRPLAPGETFVTASSGELAQDVRVVVVSPQVAAEALAAQAAAEEKK